MPECFADANYRTGAVVSHNFCNAKWGFDQGYEVFDESNVLGHHAVTSEGVTDRALAYLDSVGDDPFFLFLHYFDPHFSYLEQEDFAFREDRPPYDGPIKSDMKIMKVKRLRRSMKEEDLEELLRIYDSEVAYTDHHLGRVFDHLRESGRYDDTIIVFTADHGECFLEHGYIGHASILWNAVLHVPLIFKAPPWSGGRGAGARGTGGRLPDPAWS